MECPVAVAALVCGSCSASPLDRRSARLEPDSACANALRSSCFTLSRLLAVLALLMMLGGCAQLPSNEGREVSMALQGTSDTRLGLAVRARMAEHPGKSGIAVLSDGREAFGARMVLADAAERSL